jgi:hypothetical protein
LLEFESLSFRQFVPFRQRHAGIQMRLFARVITDLLADAFACSNCGTSRARKTLLIVTADSHGNPQSYVDAAMAAFNARSLKALIKLFNGSSPKAARHHNGRRGRDDPPYEFQR